MQYSAIDSVTEACLLKVLDVLLPGRTAFVVAHRTIRKVNPVLVLDQGRIVERGTHEKACSKRMAPAPGFTTSLSHPAQPLTRTFYLSTTYFTG